VRRNVVAGFLAVAALGVAMVAGGLVARSAAGTGDPKASPATVSTAAVELRTLQATTQVDGTLGYAASYTITDMLAGAGGPDGSNVITQIAAAGSVVVPGGKLYTLNSTQPVVLMAGATPMWRTMRAGISDGDDVKELETNLKALGFTAAGMTVDRHWTKQTTAAVKLWQKSLGVSQNGVIALGQVLFEPVSLRIQSDTAGLGSLIQRGSPVLAATSTDRIVAIALDPAMQTEVKKGDAVSVTLPDGHTAAGTVSDVGTVATIPANSGGAGSSTPTISVTVTLDDPAAAGTLDQAPVAVNITTATATNVLAVPVTSLVALLEGGYAVQTDDGGRLSYVGVQLGLFAGGWVQVTSSGLEAGQLVVVAQ